MNRDGKGTRRTTAHGAGAWIEHGKSLLILLLTASAVYFATSLPVLNRSPVQTLSPLAQQEQLREGELPVRLAIVSSREETVGVYGAAYQNQEIRTGYERLSNLLHEALSSALVPVAVEQWQWRQALETAPGIHVEMMGNVPLSAMAGWISGQKNDEIPGQGHFFVLTVWQGTTTLFYRDGEADMFYACSAEMIDPTRLTAAVSEFPGNGAFYAFQAETAQNLWPYTMLLSQPVSMRVFEGSNPLDQMRQGEVSKLLAALQMETEEHYQYTTSDGTVIRAGSDTLRIFHSGVLTYAAGEGTAARYAVASQEAAANRAEIVQRCRLLAQSLLEATAGDGQLQLLSAREEQGRWIVEFCYSLDGAQVQVFGSGHSARFVVEHAQIKEFEMVLRTYTATERTTLLLPLPQTLAAVQQLGGAGQRIRAAYQDDGGNLLVAGWTLDRP